MIADEIQSAAAPEEWVCPWGICRHEQAQTCRAEMSPRRGCGGRFVGMTSAQAAEFIKPRATITKTGEKTS